MPWRKEWLPTPVFLLGEFHGRLHPCGRKESDTTEQLTHTHTHTHSTADKLKFNPRKC